AGINYIFPNIVFFGLFVLSSILALMLGFVMYYCISLAMFWVYGTVLKEQDVITRDLWEVWGGAKEETIRKFDEFFSTRYVDKIKPAKGAVEGIAELIKLGFDIYVVTARPTMSAENTLRWLNKYFKESFNERVYFSDDASGYTKSCICGDLGVEVIIEDAPSHAVDCAVDRKVLLYDKRWNRKCEGKNIIRVSSWADIIKYLKAPALSP
ncbi:MAG: hypothetical protein HY363_04920, partial [Candidatus Aenigmarchaeota archaeon]|nr:hypothetical protein [Candidatus Aenigmarchaeota archaeon]